MKTLKDFDFKNKRVLVRCDFNVPLDSKGIIQDDFRIKQAVSTINYLVGKKAKVILMSHLGQPKGKIIKTLKLSPIQKKLEKHLNFSISKADDCIGKKVEEQTSKIKEGGVLLLENLRFYKEEEDNDPKFAKKLSDLADIYINDAFSVSHRTHASIVGVSQYLPSGAGFFFVIEIEVLSKVLKSPKRPLIVVIGGAKIKDKAGVIKQFEKKADYVLIGGKVAEFVKKVNKNVFLPIDGIGEGGLILDIGPITIDNFSKIIKKAKMVLWVGPMGLSENPLFEKGTKEIAKAIANNKKAYKIAGGGDTIFALKKFGFREKFDHISTGGGATLNFLSGKELPGLKALGK